MPELLSSIMGRCCRRRRRRRLLCFLIQKFFIHKNNIAFGSKYSAPYVGLISDIYFYETLFVYEK